MRKKNDPSSNPAQQPRADVAHQDRRESHISRLELKKLGLAAQILRTPMAADLDASGDISGGEALLLGFALSLDAFGAGISTALIGYPPWLTALSVGVMAGLSVYLGVRFGAVFSSSKWMNRLAYAPGAVLILLGLTKVW